MKAVLSLLVFFAMSSDGLKLNGRQKKNPFEWASDSMSDLIDGLIPSNGFVDVPPAQLQTILDSISFGQGCPDRNHPKLAICVHGLSKGFIAPDHVKNFENNLMKLVQDAGAVGITRNKPDIFVDLHMGGDSVEVAEEVMKTMQATKFSVNPGFGGASMADLGNQCWASLAARGDHRGHPVEHTLNQYKSLGGCYQMVKDAEQQSSGRKFDVVITMRPDHMWMNESSAEFSAMNSVPKSVRVHSFGQGLLNMPDKIQCEKSFFKRDHISVQTRAAFEMYGRIWLDDLVSPTPRRTCIPMHRSEQVPQLMVNWMNSQETTQGSCYHYKPFSPT